MFDIRLLTIDVSVYIYICVCRKRKTVNKEEHVIERKTNTVRKRLLRAPILQKEEKWKKSEIDVFFHFRTNQQAKKRNTGFDYYLKRKQISQYSFMYMYKDSWTDEYFKYFHHKIVQQIRFSWFSSKTWPWSSKNFSDE